MRVLLQILLAIGSPAFEGLMIRLGGPKIVIGTPFIDTRPYFPPGTEIVPFLALPTGGTVTHDYSDEMKKSKVVAYGDFQNRYYMHVSIRNEQRSRMEYSTAYGVNATFSFFDLNGSPVGGSKHHVGRWENASQLITRDEPEKFRFWDISPEDKQNLDIATCSKKGGDWYAWNNDSYPFAEYPSNRLGANGFIFQLSLNARNAFRKIVKYRFSYTGDGKTPEFTKLNLNAKRSG